MKPRVIAAVISDDIISVFRKDIDEFSFSFVSPLCSND